jgi:hypothetical protein
MFVIRRSVSPGDVLAADARQHRRELAGIGWWLAGGGGVVAACWAGAAGCAGCADDLSSAGGFRHAATTVTSKAIAMMAETFRFTAFL